MLLTVCPRLNLLLVRISRIFFHQNDLQEPETGILEKIKKDKLKISSLLERRDKKNLQFLSYKL